MKKISYLWVGSGKPSFETQIYDKIHIELSVDIVYSQSLQASQLSNMSVSWWTITWGEEEALNDEYKGNSDGEMYDGYSVEWTKYCNCVGDCICAWHWYENESEPIPGICYYCARKEATCGCSSKGDCSKNHIISITDKSSPWVPSQDFKHFVKLTKEERRKRRKQRKKRCKENNIDMYDSDESENSYPLEKRKDYMYYYQKCPFLPRQERLSMKKKQR